MIDWTRLRPAASVALLVGLGESLGVPVSESLKNTELTADMLKRPEVRVGGVTEIEVVRNLQRALPDHQHLGLLAGQRYHLPAYGTVGFAMECAANLAESGTLMVRYQELLHSMVDLDSDRDATSLTRYMSVSFLPPDVQRFYLQRDMANIQNVARDVVEPGYEPARTAFSQQAPTNPESLQAFRDFYGPHVEFGAERTCFTHLMEKLLLPLRRSAPEQMPALLARCDQELAELKLHTATTARVQRHIEASLADGANIDDVAAAMATSPRTLRRQLQTEGTRYRDVLDAVRARVASDLLARRSLTVAQISQQLGYDNPPAFTTAFRRWFGLTPSEFRLQSPL